VPTRSDALASARSRVGRALRAVGLRRDDTAEAPPPAILSDPTAGTLGLDWFVNPIAEGADPFVVRDGETYFWCQSDGDRGVAVSRSTRLTSRGERRVVWRAPETGPHSREVWAPELHHLDGRWHIYLAASDGHNREHRAYVLVADSDDPQGSYTLHGPLATGDADGPPQWAIDMTVLELGGQRYAVWSGWPDEQTPVQHLYIASLATPTALGGPRVQLTSPFDYPWERIADDSDEAINEAPQVLTRNGRTFLLFSCGSALLPSYKLALLELVGKDPLDPACWHKHPEPVFSSTESTFGVGHGSTLTTPDGSQWWLAFHAKINRRRNFKRVTHVQPMGWTPDGLPTFGDPVAAGTPLALPRGTPIKPCRDGQRWDLLTDLRGDFDYFGHQQYVEWAGDGLHLGGPPAHPVNVFRSAEKVVLRDGDFTDLRVSTDLRVVEGRHAAGVLLRTSAPAVGVDAHRGYFVGWVARGRLVLGRSDGSTWTVLDSRGISVDGTESPTVIAEARGDQITAYLASAPDQRVQASDATYARGSVGLRVVGTTHAVFSSLTVELLS